MPLDYTDDEWDRLKPSEREAVMEQYFAKLLAGNATRLDALTAWRQKMSEAADREHWRHTFAGQIVAQVGGLEIRDGGELLKRRAKVAVWAAEALCDALETPGGEPPYRLNSDDRYRWRATIENFRTGAPDSQQDMKWALRLIYKLMRAEDRDILGDAP